MIIKCGKVSCMQVTNYANVSVNFRAFNIEPEAEKQSKHEKLGRAIDLVKDTQYVNVNLCGPDATPYIETPYGSYTGTFSYVPKPQKICSEVYGHGYEVNIEACKSNNSYLTKNISPYDQFWIRNNSVKEDLRLVFPNRTSYNNFYKRVRTNGNLYERAAIVAKTLDEMIKSEDDISIIRQRTPLKDPLFVSPSAESALSDEVSLGRIEQILSENTNVRMQIFGPDAMPEIVTPFGRYRKIFNPFIPIKRHKDVLYISTIWGDRPIQIRTRMNSVPCIKTIKTKDNINLKLRFNNQKEAEKAYEKIQNAPNVYERCALVAMYMDKLGMGRVL